LICLLIIAVVVGLVFVILPQLAKRRAKTSRIGCTNNLKQIALSFRIWAGDNNDEFPMNVSVTNGGAMELALRGSIYESFLVMSNELSTPKILVLSQWRSNSKRRAGQYFCFGRSSGQPGENRALHSHQQPELLRWLGRHSNQLTNDPGRRRQLDAGKDSRQTRFVAVADQHPAGMEQGASRQSRQHCLCRWLSARIHHRWTSCGAEQYWDQHQPPRDAVLKRRRRIIEGHARFGHGIGHLAGRNFL
jgi:competence protein ComGC